MRIGQVSRKMQFSAINLLVQVYAIDQMIEEMLGHLGPEKTAERSKAIAERKEEEATFLATAKMMSTGKVIN